MDKRRQITEVEIEQDIQKLESGIKKLKVHYDMFFSGGQERQPLELRRKIEKLIRKYNRHPPKVVSHQFLLNTLINRFNTFSELWGRNLRMREMGVQQPHLTLSRQQNPRGAAAEKEGRPPAEKKRNGGGDGSSRIIDPESQRSEIQKLYERFAHLHQRNLGEYPKITFEAFARSIERSTVEIKRKSGCRAVDFRVAVGDNERIRIKAKPIQ